MVPGIDIIGPLPPDIQKKSMTVVVLRRGFRRWPSNPDGAKGADPVSHHSRAAAYKSKGLDVS